MMMLHLGKGIAGVSRKGHLSWDLEARQDEGWGKGGILILKALSCDWAGTALPLDMRRGPRERLGWDPGRVPFGGSLLP